jgi:hypothetical protein
VTAEKKLDRQASAVTIKATPAYYAYKVTVVNPRTEEVVDFVVDYEYSIAPLERVMTLVSYHETHAQLIDANFTSLYSEETKTFVNYVQCLAGVEISNAKHPSKGKIWVPYINGKAFEWDVICTTTHKVLHSDVILWLYQDPGSEDDCYRDAPSPSVKPRSLVANQ